MMITIAYSILSVNKATQFSDSFFIILAKKSPWKLSLSNLKLKMLAL